METKANRVGTVDVPRDERVEVLPGDLLGIYYQGAAATVPFENCTVSRPWPFVPHCMQGLYPLIRAALLCPRYDPDIQDSLSCRCREID